MGLGINTATASGDIIPIVKYDARAGRIFRVDRDEATRTNNPVDITNSFSALVDMENIEVGWMNFNTGGAPDFRMVALGDDAGQRPGESHKEGFRVMLKLGKAVGGDVRELSSVAKVVVQGFDALHDAWLASKDENAGKLPVVKISETRPVTAGAGEKKSTNYMPVFEITGWQPRPTDLVFKPRATQAARTVSSTPSAPSTGAKPMTAPPTQPAQSPEPAMAGADDDFG